MLRLLVANRIVSARERDSSERETEREKRGAGLKNLSIGKESLLESWNDFLPTLPTLVAAKLLKWQLRR